MPTFGIAIQNELSIWALLRDLCVPTRIQAVAGYKPLPPPPIIEYFTAAENFILPVTKYSVSLPQPSRMIEHEKGLRLQRAPIQFNEWAATPKPLLFSLIARPLIIIGHGAQSSAIFNICDIYGPHAPRDGSVIFMGVANHKLGIDLAVDDISHYLTRAITPTIHSGSLYSNTYYPFQSNISEHLLGRDAPPYYATTLIYTRLQNILLSLRKEQESEKIFLDKMTHDPNSDRFTDLATSKSLCDVVYVRSGITTLSEIIRMLHEQFGFVFRHIRVVCCRAPAPSISNLFGFRSARPSFRFDHEAKIRRECQEFGLHKQYPIQIATILNLIQDIVNHFDITRHVMDPQYFDPKAIEQIEIYIPDLIFYMNKYFELLGLGIVGSFDEQLRGPIIKQIIMRLGNYYLNKFKRHVESITSIISEAEIHVYLHDFCVWMTFQIFNLEGHIQNFIASAEFAHIMNFIISAPLPMSEKYDDIRGIRLLICDRIREIMS